MSDTAPPPAPPPPARPPGLRAGLLEGTKRAAADAPWGYGFSPR